MLVSMLLRDLHKAKIVPNLLERPGARHKKGVGGWLRRATCCSIDKGRTAIISSRRYSRL